MNNTLEKHTLHIALKEPERLAAISAEELEKISSRFPYFNTAHLMLTKVYQRDDDYRFTDQLHQAAIYSSDRTMLYDLVHSAKLQHGSTETAEQQPAQDIRTAESEPAATATNLTFPIEPENSLHSAIETIDEDDEVASILLEKPLDTETPRSVIEIAPSPAASELLTPLIDEDEIVPSEETILTAAEAPAEEASAEAEETIPVIHASDFDPLQREILLEAISSSIEMEVSEGVEDSEETTIQADIRTNEEPKSVSIEISESEEPLSMAAYLARRAKQLHFGVSGQSEDSPAGSESFIPEEKTNADEPRRDVWPKNNSDEEDLPWEDTSTTLSHGHKRINSGDERTHQQSLIDKFIKAEPRITPGKAGDYSLQTAARESLEEDFEFVTETMARLFAQQGKPDKARKAFKKLMEQHPEKSVYFAAQLKNVDRIKKP